MPSSIAITNTGNTLEDLTAMTRKCKDARQARRLRAIVRVMEGVLSRGEIARMARVGRQTLCDWAGRFNAEGAGGLKPEGPPPQRAAAGAEGAGARRGRGLAGGRSGVRHSVLDAAVAEGADR